MKLTQRVVDTISPPPGRDDWLAWDDECRGLALRIQKGKRTWIVRYRVRGTNKQRQITLGPAAGLSLKRAREAAVPYIMDARKGIDRASQERQAADTARLAQEAAKGRRLGVLAEKYLAAAEKSLRPGTLREARRYLAVHWAPLHGHVADELDRRTIVARLEEIAGMSGPVAANRAKAYLSMALAWGVDRGLLAVNPCAGISALTREAKRERVLAESELRDLWRALPAGDFGDILRLLILTGQRKYEVADMAWSELDLGKAEWTIPAARAKNRLAHLVPLSPPARAILAARPRRPGRDLVFGASTRGFSGWGYAKDRVDAAVAQARAVAAGSDDIDAYRLPPWTIHDLRRSVVTHMNERGIAPPHIIEAVINHISGHKAGVAGVYNLAGYGAEKRRALEAWAAHVLTLVSGEARPGNVIELPVRAG